jgi:hypothetical protein
MYDWVSSGWIYRVNTPEKASCMCPKVRKKTGICRIERRNKTVLFKEISFIFDCQAKT